MFDRPPLLELLEEPFAQTPSGKIVVMSTRATFVMQERPAHTRTWNLKAALGPKPCKVNQKYQHTKVNQHVLAEEAPNNPNKKQVSSLKKSIAQSCPICSVTQYTKIN